MSDEEMRKGRKAVRLDDFPLFAQESFNRDVVITAIADVDNKFTDPKPYQLVTSAKVFDSVGQRIVRRENVADVTFSSYNSHAADDEDEVYRGDHRFENHQLASNRIAVDAWKEYLRIPSSGLVKLVLERRFVSFYVDVISLDKKLSADDGF
jgi:hypothetical protein